MTVKAPRTIPKLPRGDGSLGFDTKRGKWTLRHDGHIEYGDSRRDVEAKRDARKAAIADAKVIKSGDVPSTLAELFDRWLAAPQIATNINPATLRNYAWSARQLCALAGQADPVTLTVADVKALLHTLKAQTSSMPKIKSVLGQAMVFAVDSGWRETNPVYGTGQITGGKAKGEQTNHLKAREFAAARELFMAEPTTEHALFATMMFAGLRPGEALALRWEHITGDYKMIEVENATTRTIVDGNPVITSRLKTDRHGRNAHRRVGIAPQLRTILQRERKAQMARGASEFCFTNADGSLIRHPQAWTMARRISARLGLATVVPPNGFRHSFATNCASNHMTPETGAMLMGHKDTKMWTTVYTHPAHAADDIDMSQYFATG